MQSVEKNRQYSRARAYNAYYCTTLALNHSCGKKIKTIFLNMAIIKISGVAAGSFGGDLQPPPIELQMTSYIIETVRTKCIIGEARKVRNQKYDKLPLKSGKS